MNDQQYTKELASDMFKFVAERLAKLDEVEPTMPIDAGIIYIVHCMALISADFYKQTEKEPDHADFIKSVKNRIIRYFDQLEKDAK